MIALNIHHYFILIKHERTFVRITFLIMLKKNISDVCSHKYEKIEINLNDDLCTFTKKPKIFII